MLDCNLEQFKSRIRVGERKKIDEPVLRADFLTSPSCSRWRDRQAKETHQASEPGKAGAERQRDGRTIVTAERKTQGRERGAEGLSGQAGGRDDAARAAAAIPVRRKGQTRR